MGHSCPSFHTVWSRTLCVSWGKSKHVAPKYLVCPLTYVEHIFFQDWLFAVCSSQAWLLSELSARLSGAPGNVNYSFLLQIHNLLSLAGCSLGPWHPLKMMSILVSALVNHANKSRKGVGQSHLLVPYSTTSKLISKPHGSKNKYRAPVSPHWGYPSVKKVEWQFPVQTEYYETGISW